MVLESNILVCYNKFMHMNKRLFVVLCLVGLVFVGFSSQPVYASDGIIETNLFGNVKDDGEGCGVSMIINLIVDILSMGVAILAVIGVTIAGITYLTAKDSEEKTRKAKNRIFEIVIGLVAYAVLYVGVQWLLPGGRLNTTCGTVSDEELSLIREQEKANNTNNGKTGTSSAKPNKKTESKKSVAETVAQVAKELSWPKGTSKKKYDRLHYPKTAKLYGDSKKLARKYGLSPGSMYNCNAFVRLVNSVVAKKKVGDLLTAAETSYSSFKSLSKKLGYKAFKISNSSDFKSKLKRGDIVAYKYYGNSGQHIYIYLGNNRVAQANHTPYKKQYYSHITGAKGKLITTSGKRFVYVARPPSK